MSDTAGSTASSPAESSAAESSESSPAEPSPAESSPAASSPAESSPAESESHAGSSPAESSAVAAPDGLNGFLFTSISAEGHDLVEGKPLTISFSTGGKNGIGLNAGCNGMGGTPEFTGSGASGSIIVRQIISTMMACSEKGVMEQEQWYSKWMTAGVDYELKGDTLELSGDGVTVIFERTGPADPEGTDSGGATVTSSVAASQPDRSSAVTPSGDATIPATPATVVSPTSLTPGQPAPTRPSKGQDEIGPPKVPEN